MGKTNYIDELWLDLRLKSRQAPVDVGYYVYIQNTPIVGAHDCEDRSATPYGLCPNAKEKKRGEGKEG